MSPARPLCRRSRLVAAGVVLAVVVGACSSDDDAAAPESGEVEADETDSVAAEPTGTGPGDTESGSDTADAPQLEAAATLEGQSGLVAEAVVTADRPVAVTITATSADHTVETPLTAERLGEHTIPIVGMRADTEYTVSVTAYDETGEPVAEAAAGSVTTDALPEWMPNHQITVTEAAAPGITLVETSPPMDRGEPRFEGQPDQVLVAYDEDAEIVWWYTNTGSIGAVEQTDDGTFLSNYWPFGIRENDVYGELVGHWRPQARDVVEGEVDDDALQDGVDPDQVDLWIGALEGNPGDMEPLPVRADWVDLNSFHHENWPMPNGNVLALSTTIHELSDEQRAAFCPRQNHPFDVISDVVVEFEPDGTVVRTWDLWDAIDVDENPGSYMCIDTGIFSEVQERDWTHANSVVYDPERDAIIISSRHTDQIVAFDHLEDEGHQTQVRWIMGTNGTIPLDGEQTYHQHAVEVLDNGDLIVYDNGNDRPGTDPDDPDNLPYSRAVVYEVDDASDDPADWSARQVWEHTADEDDGTPVYASFISDADVLSNGNVLITHGGIGDQPPDPEDPDNVPLHALIIEVIPEGDSGGETVWEFRSDPSTPSTSYRAERIDTFYVGDRWRTP